MLPPFDQWLSSTTASDVVVARHASDAGLARRRKQRLADLLATAKRGSRLYQPLLKDQDPAQVRLQDLPIMHKSDLMHRFGDWVTDPEIHLDELRSFMADRTRIGDPFLGRYVVWESSGSSGEPGIFIQDARAMAVYDALEAIRRPPLRPLQRLIDPFFLWERSVFVGATGGHFASTVSVERLRRLNPVLSRNLHSVSFLQPTDQLVAELNALAPTILSTYPSAAVLLAEEHLAGRLHIAPQEIWTGGETLSPVMRNFVQQTFGCPVSNSYGASEFLAMASECRCGMLHLNSDWVILEPVDEHGEPVPLDQHGATTLLTNLANHVQPLIRYDLGDSIAVQSQACKCGSRLPVIEVQGRADDTLRLGLPGAPSIRVLPLAVTTVLEDDAGLFDFQLVQQGACDLLLRTSLCGEAGNAALQRARQVLAAYLEQQGVTGVSIECRNAEPCRPERSGKIRRVIAL
ncbi:MAG: phenylacetate--CoA ligase family protein [Burkholderiales bacterium]|nr:phenylacetate--CoA ligase family protein [Burkholderiales bacterium]